MDSKIIKRYRQKSTNQLEKIAQEHFNKFIRLRDKDQKCISCNNSGNQAGHYFSAGHYRALRFNEDNCNLQCMPCNYYKHGNLIEYRINLVKKIGEKRVKDLEQLAAIYKRCSFKWDKMTLIEIIETYKQKVKCLKQ